MMVLLGGAIICWSYLVAGWAVRAPAWDDVLHVARLLTLHTLRLIAIAAVPGLMYVLDSLRGPLDASTMLLGVIRTVPVVAGVVALG